LDITILSIYFYCNIKTPACAEVFTFCLGYFQETKMMLKTNSFTNSYP
jgi:hypothetical protein